MEGHIGATWRMRLNRPSAAAMRPYVKILWPLVIIRPHRSTYTYVSIDLHTYTMWPIVTTEYAWSVGLSVCHIARPAKNG